MSVSGCRGTVWLFLAASLFVHVPTADVRASPFPFDTMYVFGDSLSDIGNDYNLTGGQVPPPTRYSEGRFANGPVWTQYMADAAGIELRTSQPFTPGSPGVAAFAPGESISFAYGGAATGISNVVAGGFPVPGVRGQVGLFAQSLAAQGRTADPDALYVVWGGANDYLFEGTLNPLKPVLNLQASIEDLYALGARNFLVPNLPDLGDTPIAEEGRPLDELILTVESKIHNALLDVKLRHLDRRYDDINLMPLDVDQIMNDILRDPAAFGFTSGAESGPASGCLLPPFDCSPISFAGNPLFWDEIHPSSAAHWLLAEAALDVVRMGAPRPAPRVAGSVASLATAGGSTGDLLMAVPTTGSLSFVGIGLFFIGLLAWKRGPATAA